MDGSNKHWTIVVENHNSEYAFSEIKKKLFVAEKVTGARQQKYRLISSDISETVALSIPETCGQGKQQKVTDFFFSLLWRTLISICFESICKCSIYEDTLQTDILPKNPNQ